MHKHNNEQQPTQIGLELPDYSYAYEEWIRKHQQDNNEKETVIIIENY